MNKEEILEKSRKEHQNQDIVVKEAEVKAGNIGAIAGVILCGVLYMVQLFAGGGCNWGLWAIVTCVHGASCLAKGKALQSTTQIVRGICYILATLILTGLFVYPHIMHFMSNGTI